MALLGRSKIKVTNATKFFKNQVVLRFFLGFFLHIFALSSGTEIKI
jgi:hypothetical protein